MPAPIDAKFISTEMRDVAHNSSNSNPTQNLDRMWANAVPIDVKSKGIHPVTALLRYSVIALLTSALKYACVPVSLGSLS